MSHNFSKAELNALSCYYIVLIIITQLCGILSDTYWSETSNKCVYITEISLKLCMHACMQKKNPMSIVWRCMKYSSHRSLDCILPVKFHRATENVTTA